MAGEGIAGGVPLRRIRESIEAQESSDPLRMEQELTRLTASAAAKGVTRSDHAARRRRPRVARAPKPATSSNAGAGTGIGVGSPKMKSSIATF